MGMADEGGLLFDKLQRRDPADEWSRPPPKPNRDRKVSEQKSIFPCEKLGFFPPRILDHCVIPFGVPDATILSGRFARRQAEVRCARPGS